MRSIKSFTSLILMTCVLAACQSNPFAHATTPLDKAHVALSSLEIVQTEALTVIKDPSTPAAVTVAIKAASHDATLAAVQLSGAALEVEQARADLIAGGPTAADKLQVATNKLVQWTNTVLTRIKSIQAAIKEAKNHG